MFKKLLFVFVSAILIVVGIIISHNHKPTIVGTWKSNAAIIGLSEPKSTEVFLTFNSDGTALFKNPSISNNAVDVEFEYAIKDDALSILSINNAKPQNTDNIYKYYIKKDMLTIYFREQEFTYQKVK